MLSGDDSLRDFRARQDARRADAYAEFFAPVTAGFSGQLADLVGPVAADGRALDLGCGDGALAATLSARGWRVVAADHSAAMVARARDAAGGALVADAMALPFRGNTFDAITAGFLLPHLNDLACGLGQAHRVLRPGGWLALAGWAAAPASPFVGLGSILLAERAGPREAARLAEAARRTDIDHLTKALTAAGFVEVSATTATRIVGLPSAEQWWAGLVAASCGFADLLAAQDPLVRKDVRAAFLDAAQGYRTGGDEVAVPAVALLVRARCGQN